MRYSIEIGDSSGDGHGITEIVYVKIPSSFSSKTLAKNYAANVDKLGFSYHDIADDPQNPTISAKQIKALEEAGMRFVYADFADEEADDFLKEKRSNKNIVVVEKEPSDHDDASYYFFENDLNYTCFIRIIMFMIGNGLPDFTWKFDDVNAKALVGFTSDIAPQSAGYGFFGN